MTNLELVAAELDAAKVKHPHFVDALLPPLEMYGPEWYDRHLGSYRANLADAIANGKCYLHHVLGCEGQEAFHAYAHGDLAHAVQELAQCAAVCIRAMEHIEKEMEEKE